MIDIIGEKVMVYYNLHKKTFSVKHKNKVVAHTDNLVLKDVEFRVGTKFSYKSKTPG